MLHEEVGRLADRDRRPVILCYLQGLTSEEAARELSWPVGTVRSRLARAGERLRGRLERRGVVFSAALFGASLATDAQAAVPPMLAGSTVATVMKDASGGAAPEALGPLVDAGLATPAGRPGRWPTRRIAGASFVGLIALTALVVRGWTRSPATPRPAATTAPTPLSSVLLADRLPSVWSLALSADGRTLASAHNEELRLWDLGRRQPIWRVPVKGRTVRRVDLGRDGRLVAAAQSPFGGQPAEQDVVTLRDPADGHVLRTIRGHDQGENCVAVSPDGRLVASNDWYDDVVRLWDAATGQLAGTLAGHTGAVVSVAFSPDGQTLASTSNDQTVRLWDVSAHTERRVFRGHTKGVEAVAFAPDGRRLASGSYDGTLRVGDAASGRELASLTLPASVLAVAFHPKGPTVAAAVARWGPGQYDTAPSQLVLWTPGSDTPAQLWASNQAQVFGLAIAPDGRTLLSAGLDGSIRLWPLTPPERPRR